jgi:hypothetical protein
MRPQRPYRLGLWHWWHYVIVGGLLLFWVVAVGRLVLGKGDPGDGLLDRVGEILVITAFLGVFAGWSWSWGRIGVFVDDDGIVIRTHWPWATRRIAWDDIAGFDTAPVPRPFRTPAGLRCLRVRLLDAPPHLVEELNTRSPTTWLGAKPTEIASRLQQAHPHPRP